MKDTQPRRSRSVMKFLHTLFRYLGEQRGGEGGEEEGRVGRQSGEGEMVGSRC